MVQWASSGDHLSGATSSRPVFLNFNARRVRTEDEWNSLSLDALRKVQQRDRDRLREFLL